MFIDVLLQSPAYQQEYIRANLQLLQKKTPFI